MQLTFKAHISDLRYVAWATGTFVICNLFNVGLHFGGHLTFIYEVQPYQ